MLSFASLLLIAMAGVMAVLVSVSSRALLRSERVRAPSRAATFGVQVTLGLLIALAAFWLFTEVADNVIDRDKLERFDALVLVLLAPWRTSTGLEIAKVVSRFGTSLVMSALALVVLLVLHRHNWRAVVVGWVLVFGGGKLVEALLKHTIHRARPIGAIQQLNNPSYSYPSGHAMGAMIGYGVLAYLILLRVHRPQARAAVTATVGLVILAIGLSRLVLGVHYFTDVVGGYAAGAVWLALSLAAVEAARVRFAGDTRPDAHRRAA
jgi:undecaprenyl-diphosphatase